MSGVADRVARGAPLSVALADAPGCFDSEMVGLCRAGEAEGELAAALAAMERSFAARDEFRRRARTALTYPLFAAATLGATLVFLFGSRGARPRRRRFRSPVRRAGLARPTAAPDCLGGADGRCAGAGHRCGAGARASNRGTRRRCRRRRSRRRGVAGAARGRLAGLLETARFARTVARLERRDASLPGSLGIAAGAVGRPALRAALVAVRARVIGGAGFGAALRDARHVPPVLARYATAGEASGALPDALERAAHALEHDARTALERIERLVGPALLCVVGLVLLWIVASIVLPVYDAAIGAGLGA